MNYKNIFPNIQCLELVSFCFVLKCLDYIKGWGEVRVDQGTNLSYAQNSAFFDNKKKLIQVGVNAGVTLHWRF